MPSLEEAAVNYAKLGFYVFPLQPRSKEPATYHGFKDASNVPETVRAWWLQNPDYNIGIAAGHGLIVLDIDNKESEGKYGSETLRSWEKEHGEIAPTWTVLTGTGGLHYWYKTDLNFKNIVEVLPGIDIRSLGGYVVAPPSIHPNGQPYEWEASGDPEDLPMAQLSGSALQLARQSESTQSDGSKRKKSSLPPYKELKEIKSGHRQDALMALQGYLMNLNLTEEAIKAAVREENEAKCSPPMSEAELEKEIFPFLRRNVDARADYTETVVPAQVMDDGIKEDELNIPTLDQITQEKAEWFEQGYIPAKSITILCGTGGVGKTSIWCSIAAAVTRGEQSFLTARSNVKQTPKEGNRKVMFFSAEDSVSVVLKDKMQKAKAVQQNVMCLDVSDERFRDVKLSSAYLEKLIAKHRPALCVFDPIQAFIDKRVKMSDRNAMRQEIEPLIKLGQKYGTTFLIVMHTNKQSNVWGRQRMADSSDIWDVARSVLMVGDTGDEGYGYISQEKNSYARMADTVIFKNEAGITVYSTTTDKKDRDFVLEATSRRTVSRSSDELQDAENLILSELASNNGRMRVADLTEEMTDLDYSENIIKRAKQELKKAGMIYIKKDGYEGKNYICTYEKPPV